MKNRSASATAARACLPEPEDPTPGTLVPNPGNPPLHFFEPKATRKKHHKGHAARNAEAWQASGREGIHALRGRIARISSSSRRRCSLPARPWPSTSSPEPKASTPTSTKADRPATQAGSHPARLTFSVDFEGSRAAGRRRAARPQPRTAAGPARKPDRDRADLLQPGRLHNPAQLALGSEPLRRELPGQHPGRHRHRALLLRRRRNPHLRPLQSRPHRACPLSSASTPTAPRSSSCPRSARPKANTGSPWRRANVSQLLDVSGLTLTIWGVPWSVLHNDQRGNCLNEAEPAFGWAKCSVGPPGERNSAARLPHPADLLRRAARFTASANSWQQPAPPRPADAGQRRRSTGCDSLDFEPQRRRPADQPPRLLALGLRVRHRRRHLTASPLHPGARAGCPTPVRKAVVALPEGVTINPSVGAGPRRLHAGPVRAETPTSPPGAGCPNESKIGDFTVRSPLVAGALEGRDLPRRAATTTPSAPDRRLPGRQVDPARHPRQGRRRAAAPTPRTGSLTATFDDLPQLPYSDLQHPLPRRPAQPAGHPGGLRPDLDRGRPHALARREPGPARIAARRDHRRRRRRPLPRRPRALRARGEGGTLNSHAGAYSPFYLHLTRNDASRRSPPTRPHSRRGCSASSPASPTAPTPRSPPRGAAPGSTSATTPPARRPADRPHHLRLRRRLGPHLRARQPLPRRPLPRRRRSRWSRSTRPWSAPSTSAWSIVRSAIRIDPATAQASIDATGTDPIPHIVNGIPIHLRDVRVYIDRPASPSTRPAANSSSVASALNGAGAALRRSRRRHPRHRHRPSRPSTAPRSASSRGSA